MWYQVKRNKFNAKKTEFNGRTYDSRLEAGVASDIELLRKSGKVVKVEPQKTFNLYGRNGARICTHRVDFLLTFKDGHQEAWEAKGVTTAIWSIKRKLFEDNYPDIIYMVITAKGWYTGYRRK